MTCPEGLFRAAFTPAQRNLVIPTRERSETGGTCFSMSRWKKLNVMERNHAVSREVAPPESTVEERRFSAAFKLLT